MLKVPFTRGVNFSAWFETININTVNFARYTEQDFLNVKSLGADVIRVPVRMHSFTLGAPEFIVEPLLFNYLDTVFDWAEKNKIYLILDNHSFDPRASTSPDVDKILSAVWEQMAQRYKNRSEYILYEVLNEPHGIDSERWGIIQGLVIDKIRSIDKTRIIIAGGVDFNSIGKMNEIPEYADDKIIYTFHYYDPHIFTHQGATWGHPSLASLAGVPFPAEKIRIPGVPADLRGTWVESALGNLHKDASAEVMQGRLDIPMEFSKKRQVPVFCGEFGVYLIQSPPSDRINWYKFTINELNQRQIPWTSWDYYGGFGLFNTGKPGDFKTDLNRDLVNAMGFTLS